MYLKVMPSPNMLLPILLIIPWLQSLQAKTLVIWNPAKSNRSWQENETFSMINNVWPKYDSLERKYKQATSDDWMKEDVTRRERTGVRQRDHGRDSTSDDRYRRDTIFMTSPLLRTLTTRGKDAAAREGTGVQRRKHGKGSTSDDRHRRETIFMTSPLLRTLTIREKDAAAREGTGVQRRKHGRGSTSDDRDRRETISMTSPLLRTLTIREKDAAAREGTGVQRRKHGRGSTSIDRHRRETIFMTSPLLRTLTTRGKSRHSDPSGMKCPDGYFGNQCQKVCNSKCLDGCEKRDGQCNRCPDGWFGKQCQQPCPPHCGLSGNGRNCHLLNGNCSDGCESGFAGTHCHIMCDYCINSMCTFDDGTCIKGYNNVTTSTSPNLTCSQHCKTCSENKTVCLKCEPGYSEPECKREVLIHESGTCARNESTIATLVIIVVVFFVSFGIYFEQSQKMLHYVQAY